MEPRNLRFIPLHMLFAQTLVFPLIITHLSLQRADFFLMLSLLAIVSIKDLVVLLLQVPHFIRLVALDAPLSVLVFEIQIPYPCVQGLHFITQFVIVSIRELELRQILFTHLRVLTELPTAIEPLPVFMSQRGPEIRILLRRVILIDNI